MDERENDAVSIVRDVVGAAEKMSPEQASQLVRMEEMLTDENLTIGTTDDDSFAVVIRHRDGSIDISYSE